MFYTFNKILLYYVFNDFVKKLKVGKLKKENQHFLFGI